MNDEVDRLEQHTVIGVVLVHAFRDFGARQNATQNVVQALAQTLVFAGREIPGNTRD